MATQDISRFLLQPNKHYSAVHMQQGRVIVDSDWNERANIEAEDLRASLLDIICSKGTPNDGMMISNAELVEDPFPSYNFNIGVGSYYLGGLRFAVDQNSETFLAQHDWLQIDDGDQLPDPVTEPRIDLVYVSGWEQPVTAVEDSELREVALGGRDTSTRVKRFRRFMVRANVGTTDFSNAFTVVTDGLIAGCPHSSYDPETCEWRSGGRLEVGFVNSGKEEDLCADPAATGYVAAENQAIRVELREGSKWVWGFDNASKLYRVKVGAVGVGTTTLSFLTEPADLPSMPRAGQVVELLPWGALLPNREKVAEAQGVITTVSTSYDPTAKTLIIGAAVSTSWIDWLAAHIEYHNLADGDEEQEYLYLRVWDRGAELVDGGHPAELDVDVGGVAKTLGSTGLSVKFFKGGIPGDYWIIAARPSTPELVTPWDLATEDGVPPHGPHRFIAPLAVIEWTEGEGEMEGEMVPAVSDCRTKLRRLCEGGCCTVTVGDGERSFGQVSSLQDAIALVPNGGKICLLPGIHESSALLQGRFDIVIEGCGPSSILVSPTPASDDPAKGDAELFYDPVLTIRNSQRIRVQNLRIQAHSAVGVSIERTALDAVCAHVLLEDLQIFSSGLVNGGNGIYEFTAPSVAVLAASDVDIRNCDLEQDVVPSISEVVVLGGMRLRLLDCHVRAPIYDGVSTAARGGVNIRSGSYDVEVIGCVIEGGWSHGISLGHVDVFPRGETSSPLLWELLGKFVGKGLKWQIPSENTDCLEPVQKGTKKASEGTTSVWLPLGPVEKVRIHDNVIRHMGMSGVSTVEFFDSKFDWNEGTVGPVFIVAVNFDICRNTIEDNVLRTGLSETLASQHDDCVGGICLAAAINPVIRENRILRNGTENYRVPACGIGIIAAQSVLIEDNQIIDNGAPFPEDGDAEPVAQGLRGGIVIVEVTPVRGFTFPHAASGPTLPAPVTDFGGARGGSAVVVRGNQVSQPLGRALWVIRSHGAVTVTGNTLESLGNPAVSNGLFTLAWSDNTANVTRPMSGACVEIFGYSKALDVDWGTEQVAAIPPPSWVDTGEVPLEDGGNTLVSGNAIRMSWNRIGGISTTVLISTLASAVFDNNDVTVDMSSTYIAPGETVDEQMAAFYSEILQNEQEYSFAMSSVYVAGHSTGQANGNRITEGQFDALFSLTVATIVRPGGTDLDNVVHAVSATANILSHAVVLVVPTDFPLPFQIIESANAVIFAQDDVSYGVQEANAAPFGIGRRIGIVNLP